MTDLTKGQKKHLRELAAKCYEKEMSAALNELNKHFKKWESKEITTWDLDEKIHHHYKGKSRDLYKFYEQLNDPRIAVARAIANEIIAIEEVRDDCRPILERTVEYYNEMK